MLKPLERVKHTIEVKVEENLFGGPDDPLQALAERLAQEILAEAGLPLQAIRVAKADLPEEDAEEGQPEIGFYLKLACGPKQAFEWLKRLSAREYDVAKSLPEEERKLFDRTFRIGIKWEAQP
jgi:hypothetical protein